MDNEPIEATTWEQCAQHVEAGGVVEVLGGDDVWRASRYSAPFYRSSAAAPGTGGWFRHRLLPLPAAEAGPTESTGEFPVVDPRDRTEITDDFTAGTRTIRKWLDGGAVHGPSLLAELDAWLWYWGGSPMSATPTTKSSTDPGEGEATADGFDAILVDSLSDIADAFGARGVLTALRRLYPDADVGEGSGPPSTPNPMAVRAFAARIADYVATNVNADGMSKRGWVIEAIVQALEEPTAADQVRAILAVGLGAPTISEVPAGHELVVLPCDVVDDWASDGVPGSRRAVILLDACRAAVARRPKPAPKTERVHWSEAVGRKDPHDGTITMIGVPRIYVGQDSWMDVTDPDGMVEVLVEVES